MTALRFHKKGSTNARLPRSIYPIILVPLACLLIFGTLFLSSLLSSGPTSSAHASAPAQIPGHVPALIKKSQLLGPTDPNTSITLMIGLQLRNQASLQAYVDDLTRPHSVNARHYLTTAQIAAAYGPLPTSQAAVIAYMQQAGFTKTATFKHHVLIGFKGTIGDAEHAFNIQINNYRAPSGPSGRQFYAPTTDPIVPGTVAAVVQSITGLDTAGYLTHPRVLSSKQPLNVSATPTAPSISCFQAHPGYYLPNQIADAYNLTGLHNAGFQGEGQSVATYELDDYLASDIQIYASCFGGTAVLIKRILVNGGPGAPPGAGALEVELDAELLLSAAPHLASLNIYEAHNDFASALALWAQIVSDAVPVVTSSWGTCEPGITSAYAKQENALFAIAAAQGQSIFVASGDNGSNDCGVHPPTTPTVGDPAAQPYVTSVGGTTLTLNGASYGSETTWNNNIGASGGGISSYWTMPTWQQGPGVINATFSSGKPCGASTGKYCRQIPDVSLSADPNFSYVEYCTVGSQCANFPTKPWIGVGGTSASAPMWAAFAVLANQKSLHDGNFNLGFLNPLFYQLGSGASYSTDFHDITTGNNYTTGDGKNEYPAALHYDMATGLGTYNAVALATDLEALAKSLTNSRSSPASTTWYFAEGSVGNSFQEFITLLNPSPTQTATVNITYLFENKPALTIVHSVSPSSRATVSANADLAVATTAPQQAISAIVNSNIPIVAERPMYFNLHGIASGTDVLGATNANNTTFYFAEGDSRNVGRTYLTYITLLNPSSTSTAHVTITYYSAGSIVGTEPITVGPLQRGTGTPATLGLHQQVAIKVVSDIGIVVERPMYFNDTIPTAGGTTTGSASAVGATTLGPNTGSDWLFAEGYTGNGTNFQEYLVLANFTTTNANVNVKLEYTNGTVQTVPVVVSAQSQYYFDVNNAFAHPIVGCGCTPTPTVSAEVYSSTASIVAERLMYFHYSSALISGGTDVVGEAGPASHMVYSFAEGFTYGSFAEYLTLQNPNNSVETVAITLFADNTIVQEMRQLPPHSRTTVSINALIVPMATAYPTNPAVYGYEVSMDVQVVNGGPVVAERPLYFVFHGEPGGTDVLGYTGG